MAQSQGFTLWLTGMLGTGKTTMANYIAARLRQVDRCVEVLDEDELMEVLWDDVEETKDERLKNTRRLGHVAGLLSRNGVAALVAATSPYKSARDDNRRSVHRYLEVYVDCPTQTLIERDTTGKYKKALGGEIPNFIGITEPYEPPTSPEVTLHSDRESVEEGAMRIFQSLLDLGCLSQDELKVITGKKMKPMSPKERAAARAREKAEDKARLKAKEKEKSGKAERSKGKVEKPTKNAARSAKAPPADKGGKAAKASKPDKGAKPPSKDTKDTKKAKASKKK